MESVCERGMHTSMFIAPPCTVAKQWKQPNYLLVVALIKKMWFLEQIGIGNNFLNRTQKAQHLRERMKK
jgi:hypothetical protein